MRRTLFFPLLILFSVLFLFLTLPLSFTAKVRMVAIRMVSPLWGSLHPAHQQSGEILQLSLENQRLQQTLDDVYEWFLSQEGIEDQIDQLEALSDKENEEKDFQEFFARRKEELKKRLEMQLQSLPAKVIFRDPLSWSSSIWINVGEEENLSLGKKVVAKDSPVIVGNAIVGVIEEVEKNQSRVRLITDAGLSASVRIVRGVSQERFFLKEMIKWIPFFQKREDLFPSKEERERFLQTLLYLQKKTLAEKREWYLAKGILQGASLPLWSYGAEKLKGIGFNYDFPDVENKGKEKRPLLSEGDLLVTSGMDGVFPAGFPIATVTRVFPIKEGACSYELEALPIAENLHDLSMIFVLPPLWKEE